MAACIPSTRRGHLPRLTLLALGLVLVTPLALAQARVTDGNVNARVERLERTLSSSSLLQMLETMQRLRQEVRELRGELEVQANDIRKLKSSQAQIYQDLDKRIAAAQAAPAPAAGDDPAAGSGSGSGSVVLVTPEPAATPQPAPAPAPVAVTAADADPAAEQSAYRAALDLLTSGKPEQAAEAFARFLGDHPNGRFADNAQYWLGEAFYVNRKFEPALKAFESLVADFPDSQKRGHALLKIGFIYDETGRKDLARKVLQDLVSSDPSSVVAGLANKRLSRLR